MLVVAAKQLQYILYSKAREYSTDSLQKTFFARDSLTQKSKVIIIIFMMIMWLC